MPSEEALERYQRILTSGQETPKIDFKVEFRVEGEARGEIIKDFCALANSVDPNQLDQRQGLLFIGVNDDGTVRGLPAQFDHDQLSLQLTQFLNQSVAPSMRFTVSPAIPDARSGQEYAVIEIEPAATLPYITLRDAARVQPGQWYVRRNSSTVLAGPEEFADLHRRLLDREVQPLRSGLDRLAGEVAVLREELARTQVRGMPGVSPVELADVPLAEAIRQEFAPRHSLLISRIHQLGRELSSQVVDIYTHHLASPQKIRAPQFDAALSALEAAARPLVEVGFEISAYVEEPDVWSAYAATLEDVVNITVVDRIRIDGELAPVLWYPVILCAYAVALAAQMHHRYQHLVPMLSGGYDRNQFPLMRVVRVLPRAEEWYAHVTQVQRCAPLAERIITTLVGTAGWFTPRFHRDPQVAGYFAEILLSLVWMKASQAYSDSERLHALPGAYLYQWSHSAELHAKAARERDALHAAFPDLQYLLAEFDRSVPRFGDGRCGVSFTARLVDTLTP